MITFQKTSTGNFEVLKNGMATKYRIFNGNSGISGNGNNIYCIENLETGTIKPEGTLVRCKKILTFTLSK